MGKEKRGEGARDEGTETMNERRRAPQDDRGTTTGPKDDGAGTTVGFYRAGSGSSEQGSLGSLEGATERSGGLQGTARAPRGETPETGR